MFCLLSFVQFTSWTEC